ncbi:DUF1439 domain-containing protein [Alginatibacterium sediminis]|uniref:DUF1439 domain-containing protein n=1 Tax=Alginatibacterium sediminis TaxID=2164068 RepID=A0A420E9D9_9ALTE|nr:DUF1439 domain-containing protein [Alginatibacterium sediminis]RKF17379.1 DUF1439 domain-containing protein [Alginatibacterium sediminis]
MRLLLILTSVVLISACSYNAGISEQKINSYLAEQSGFEQNVGLPGLFNLAIEVDDASVKLGQNDDQRIRLNAAGQMELQSPIQNLDLAVKLHFSAKPRYQADEAAIYLDNPLLEELEVKPAQYQSLINQFLPAISIALGQVLAQYPVYELDSEDKAQALAKDLGKAIHVKPGRIEFELAP